MEIRYIISSLNRLHNQILINKDSDLNLFYKNSKNIKICYIKLEYLHSKTDDGSCDKQEDYVDLLRRLVNIGETERFDKLVAILQYTKTAAESILDGQMMYLPFLMN